MPAVTVENLLVLPRVTEPAAEGGRPVVKVTTAPAGFEGEGFPVRRAFAGVSLDDLDRAARLLAEFCTGVTPQMDWTP